MGCFGYMCSSCKEQIVGDSFDGGERCVLIHKRHGEVIGQTVGKYNEYGGVIEDTLFRSDEEMENNPNSHAEICISEMDLDDSHSFQGRKMFMGLSIPVSDMKRVYIDDINDAELFRQLDAGVPREDIVRYSTEENWIKDNHEEKFKKFMDSLEDVVIKSGIIACHKVCFDKLTKAEQDNLPFSQSDPNQSWGDINPIYA